MIDKEAVQEFVSLVAICLLGAIVVAVILFVTTLAAGHSHTSSPSDSATSTVQ